jgi:transcriptional regulator with XRE-family HTH domain
MIGQRIRELRLGRGLTLQQVATVLGVTRASVSKWEQGHSHPEFSRLEELARLFGVPATHLLSEGMAPPPRNYPVVDYRKYTRVEDFVHRLGLPSNQVYPSARRVSDASFYMRFDTSEVKNLWLTGIQSGALVLFDPALPHTTDDLIYAHDARGDCQLLYAKVSEGARYYQAFIGNKDLYHEGDYLVVLGVAVESVLVTQLRHTEASSS